MSIQKQYQAAFDKFMASDIEEAIMKSTQAGFGGGGYSVELFIGGAYRLLWNNQIGNLYESPGMIIGVPQLNDDEMGDDEVPAFYDNVIQEMQERFEYACDEAQRLSDKFKSMVN
jgi:hypothetical protein